MKIRYLYFLSCLCVLPLGAQEIKYQLHPKTKAIQRIDIQNAAHDMEWLLDTSGKQYQWVTDKYSWGLGYFSQKSNGKTKNIAWKYPSSIDNDIIIYKAGCVEIQVQRHLEQLDLVETYTFKNITDSDLKLSNIGIYVPLNDNYPDAVTCLNSRTHVHIWAGDNAAYINAMQMSGKSPHVGLVLLNGCIDGYNIDERSLEHAYSNFRGVISLKIADMHLAANESQTISWKIFAHNGWNDFYQKIVAQGAAHVSCDKYVLEKNEKVTVSFFSKQKSDSIWISCNGKHLLCMRNGEFWQAEVPLTTIGDNEIVFHYGKNKKTSAYCYVIPSIKELISKRAKFIISNQQMDNILDARYGAYMIYDCEEEKLFLNDTKTVSYHDRDEGGERLGMGVFLAKYYLLNKDSVVKRSLLNYLHFVKTQLQDQNFNVWSTIDHKGRNRAYNYPWIANFYFYMYQITMDKQLLQYGYETLQAMSRNFGYGFYAIDIPVCLSLKLLKSANMIAEYDQLKADYIKVGEIYLQNGISYPSHEVNYEQSIVAPSVIFLLQLYKETGNDKYMKEAQRQMPLLEAFAGFQPSYHLNEIAIRHWDGYWFGKNETWGDVFPHYWSTLSAVAFHYYYLCTGEESYQKRAENIVRNNLCLFFETGKASCAYIYPDHVNGKPGKFYDPFANDQDWALVYYLLVNNEI